MAFFNPTQNIYQVGQQYRVQANLLGAGQALPPSPTAVSMTLFSAGAPFVNDPDQFTIKALVAGSYLLSCGITYQASDVQEGELISSWIEYNGDTARKLFSSANAFKAPSPGTTIYSVPFSAALSLNAGDYIRLMVDHSGLLGLTVEGPDQTGLPPESSTNTHITFTVLSR